MRHAAHSRRVAKMCRDALAERAITTDPARLTQIDRRIMQIDDAQIALEAKLQDPRLSEEQRIADGYRLVRPLLTSAGDLIARYHWIPESAMPVRGSSIIILSAFAAERAVVLARSVIAHFPALLQMPSITISARTSTL